MTLRAYGPGASYCPRCAAPLPGAPPTTCRACGYELFANLRPSASLVLLDGDPNEPRFLALRRVGEPRAGRWETPGGFCDGWEHPADAAVREAREELGVAVTLGDCIGMYVGGYDFQQETLPVLDIFYLATLDSGEIRLDPRESSEMKWFPLADPPALAFSRMDAAIRDAVQLLRH